MIISAFPKKHSKILSRRLKTKLCIRIRVPFLSEPCQIFCIKYISLPLSLLASFATRFALFVF